MTKQVNKDNLQEKVEIERYKDKNSGVSKNVIFFIIFSLIISLTVMYFVKDGEKKKLEAIAQADSARKEAIKVQQTRDELNERVGTYRCVGNAYTRGELGILETSENVQTEFSFNQNKSTVSVSGWGGKIRPSFPRGILIDAKDKIFGINELKFSELIEASFSHNSGFFSVTLAFSRVSKRLIVIVNGAVVNGNEMRYAREFEGDCTKM